jgi:hypothetical protein
VASASIYITLSKLVHHMDRFSHPSLPADLIS